MKNLKSCASRSCYTHNSQGVIHQYYNADIAKPKLFFGRRLNKPHDLFLHVLNYIGIDDYISHGIAGRFLCYLAIRKIDITVKHSDIEVENALMLVKGLLLQRAKVRYSDDSPSLQKWGIADIGFAGRLLRIKIIPNFSHFYRDGHFV